MAEIKLGNSGFTTRPERDALAALRRKYADIGIQYRDQFLATYVTFKTADELFHSLPDAIERTVSETVRLVANDIAANKIYHLDVATIRASLIERLDVVRERFDCVQNSYLAIIGRAAELDAQRAEAMENRGRVVGGGFGVEGAARGIAIAAAANAAIGLTQGLANLTAKAASALGDRRKKQALLENPSTKIDLADFMASIVLQGHLVVAEAVNTASTAPVYELVSEESRRKASALIENVAARRVPDTDIGDVLCQAIELDPFAGKGWRAWVDRFGDENGSVEGSAIVLGGPDLRAYKQELGHRRRAELLWSTPEECFQSRDLLEGYCNHLGLGFESERVRIQNLIEDLDRKRRTIDGILYDTVQEAEVARVERDEEMRREREEREESEKKAARERMRTFNGILYDSVEDMWVARKIYNRRFGRNVLLGISGIIGFFALLITAAKFLDAAPSRSEVVRGTPAKGPLPALPPLTLPNPSDTPSGAVVAVATAAPDSKGKFGCPGAFSDVSFSEESGDGSGLFIRIVDDRVVQIDSWEGGVFAGKSTTVTSNAQSIEAEVYFPDSTSENIHTMITCDGDKIRVSGKAWGNKSLPKISDDQIKKLYNR